MRSPSTMSKMIREKKKKMVNIYEGEFNGNPSKVNVEPVSKKDFGPPIKPEESIEEYKQRAGHYAKGGSIKHDPRQDLGATENVEMGDWEAAPEDKVDDDGASERHIDDSDQGSRSRMRNEPRKYAFGGRVLDERPGDDQGPEDSDLQDKEIERMYETADQNDHNEREIRDQGQHLSNESEDHEEEREQPIHKDRNANHEDYEKELLRNVRMSRLRKSMSR